MFRAVIFALSLLMLTPFAWAQMVEVNSNGSTAPRVGQARAEQYFIRREHHETHSAYRGPASTSGEPRYLAIQVGTYFSDQAWKWGHGDQNNLGRLNLAVSYRMGEWVHSMDFLLRAELNTYSLDEGSARKLGFLGMITFPDAASHFPLYFGAGLGPGVFIKQIHNESPITLDYELVAGARFFNVINTMGFLVELGMRNHLQLLDNGQFNGLTVSAGAVFSF